MVDFNHWIGVDLDGTLARAEGRVGSEIGEPVLKMLRRVRQWLAIGKTVKIFTARACENDPQVIEAIESWCLKHLGQRLEVTNVKDYGMTELWDDRAVRVKKNTGEVLSGFGRP